MMTNHSFFGGPLHGEQRDLDDSQLPMPVHGGTYRRSGAEGGPAIALFWPDRELKRGPGDPIAKGEPFPMHLGEEGGCPATKPDGSGVFFAACVLDEHHGGRHIASDGETVVEVWT